jgi:tetratricopeptide (TPR) repeat protein
MNPAVFLVSMLLLNTQVNSSDTSWKFHHVKADYYFHKGNYPEMLYHLSEKVKYNPKDLVSWSDLGYYYWSMSVDDKKRSEEFKTKAFKYLEEGLKKNQETAFMFDEIGRFYIYKNNDYSKAISYFEQAVVKPDCDQITFHLLALCYEKTNNINGAIKTLQLCLNKYPNDAKAKSKLNSFKD